MRARLSVALSSLLVVATLSPAVRAAPGGAKTHLDAAVAAERQKDFATASSEYQAAYAAEASAAAVQGRAGAEENLGHPVEAIDAYEQLLLEFGAAIPAKTKTLATTKIAALSAKVGRIALDVKPEGVSIAIDGAPVGVTPLAKPIRVMPGSHTISATKAEFLPRELAIDVAAAAEVSAELTLAPQPSRAPVSVKEVNGAPLTLTIDGTIVGQLPWSGELEPGAHELTATSDVSSVPKQTITVERGKKLELALTAAPRVGGVDLGTADGQGLIFVDGKVAAEGHWKESVPIGPHKFSIVRDGYERLEITHVVVDDEQWHEVVTLRPVTSAPPREVVTPPAADENGVVGEIRFALHTQLGSAGSESESNCRTLGKDCSANTPIGGGLLFAVGYMRGHFGGDLFFGGMLDNGKRTYTDLGGRERSYSVARIGGVQAIRARGSIQNERWRGNLAIGPGLAERAVGIADDFPSLPEDVQTYISLAFTVDVNGQLRLGSSTALTLGLTLWVEDAGDGVVTRSAPTDGSFHLVQGTQTFFMPYLGFQFGP